MTTPILLTNSATRTTTIYGLYKNLHYYGDKTFLADGYFQGNLNQKNQINLKNIKNKKKLSI